MELRHTDEEFLHGPSKLLKQKPTTMTNARLRIGDPRRETLYPPMSSLSNCPKATILRDSRHSGTGILSPILDITSGHGTKREGSFVPKHFCELDMPIYH